ncbi:MAG: hypothetical protein KKG10_15980 [Proteobacteria bacterium]|nr:hypothetical protein [Pseudomonadota bacterium]
MDYQALTFIRPDARFFIDTGQTADERIAFVLKILERSGNDPDSISAFMNGIHNSHDVAFAFIYGSAINSNLGLCDIEDVDVLIATQGDKKFVYEWDALRGAEIRYLRLSEIRDILRVEKRLFSTTFPREFNSLGGILANGLVVIKPSSDLERMVFNVRESFHKIYVKALSQMVENECIKRIKERSGFTKRNRPFSSHDERRYAFYGSDVRISLDEARSIIDESIKRKNIEPGKAPAIARSILKRIKPRNVLEIHRR